MTWSIICIKLNNQIISKFAKLLQLHLHSVSWGDTLPETVIMTLTPSSRKEREVLCWVMCFSFVLPSVFLLWLPSGIFPWTRGTVMWLKLLPAPLLQPAAHGIHTEGGRFPPARYLYSKTLSSWELGWKVVYLT